MEKLIVKVEPKIIKDKEGNYTIYDSRSKGGAIVSDVDLVVAMNKFKEATYLAFAVRNLMAFSKNLTSWHFPEFL